MTRLAQLVPKITIIVMKISLFIRKERQTALQSLFLRLSQEFILLKEYVNKNLSISSPSNNIIHEVHIKGVDGDEDGNAGIDLSYSKGKMKNEFCSVEKVACENVIDSSDALDLIKGRVHNEMLSENNSNQDIKVCQIGAEEKLNDNNKSPIKSLATFDGGDFSLPTDSQMMILYDQTINQPIAIESPVSIKDVTSKPSR
ncbi:hypothetical protein KY285_010427 [Solanum tuberosum]|nr:hypothetical protein KY289_010976 [Solanum tuberosum]KAH0734720.1 hypothetical protein KY285_010427 [Solanum tuberosum]